jgi:WD40 repeat protein
LTSPPGPLSTRGEGEIVKLFWEHMKVGIITIVCLLLSGLNSASSASGQEFTTGCEVVTPDNADQVVWLATLAEDQQPRDLAWSPDGQTVAIAGKDGVWLYDLENLEAPRLIRASKEGYPIWAVAFSPDGTLLATGSDRLRLFDPTTGEDLRVLPDENGAIAIAFSPDGKLLAYGNFKSEYLDGTIFLWDTETWQPLYLDLIGVNTDWVQDLAFSPDGTLLAAGTATTMILLDMDNLEKMSVFDTGVTYDVDFSPNGHLLAAGAPGQGYGVWLWDLQNDTRVAPLFIWESIRYVAFNPGGTLLALGTWVGGWIVLVDTTTGDDLNALSNAHEAADIDDVKGLAFSPDGKLLASAGGDDVKLWGVCDTGG